MKVDTSPYRSHTYIIILSHLEKPIQSQKMQCARYISVILLLIAIDYSLQQTADKSANGKTKQILTYIAGLPNQGI
jgi:hypothetical protein